MSQSHGFEFIDIPPRTAKPREAGLTIVLDKGLGLAATRDLIEMVGEYIDIVKLGWGTSRTYPLQVLKEKIRILREAGISVCPGGTFSEIAVAQSKTDDFLLQARDVGFDVLEISDGIYAMPPDEKLTFIARAAESGFQVLSEVGKKLPQEDAILKPERRVELIIRELDAGAWKVVIEGRESDAVGIFSSDGSVKVDLTDYLISEVGLEKLIFEAGKESHQSWLLQHYGTGVNLGNVAPSDVMNIETLRCGLRADTARQYFPTQLPVHIELGIAGARAGVARGDVIVVIDALRSSSTITMALEGGMRCVQPVATPAECKGEVTAAERGGAKLDGFDLGNSPQAFLDRSFAGKELALTTSNGTEAILVAADTDAEVLIGCLLNATAVAEVAHNIAIERNAGITLLAVGRNNKYAVEDVIGATVILQCLPDSQSLGPLDPVWVDDVEAAFLDSDAGHNLTSQGLTEDVVFSAQIDKTKLVPYLSDGCIVKYPSESLIHD